MTPEENIRGVAWKAAERFMDLNNINPEDTIDVVDIFDVVDTEFSEHMQEILENFRDLVAYCLGQKGIIVKGAWYNYVEPTPNIKEEGGE